jgi:acetylornithine deacetylase
MAWEDAIGSAVNEMADELSQLCADLIAVPSVGGSAEEIVVQQRIARWLTQHGLEVDQALVAVDASSPGFPGMEVPRDAVLRVVGRVPGLGTGPDLLLQGHTDVVPTDDVRQFSPRLAGDRLFGRGAADMKAGVAAMCVAAAALRHSGVRLCGDVVVAPVSAEEDGGAGAFALLTGPDGLRLAPGSAAIIPEPTAGTIVSANAGCLTFAITIRGRSAHGALRWRGANPIDGVPAVLAALRRLEEQRCADPGPLFEAWPLAYPISIGTIAGGDWASTVPEQVTLTGRYGVRLGESLPQARRALEAAVAAAADSDPYLASHPPEIRWWGAQFESAATPSDAAVIDALRLAGAPPALSAAPYGSDLRLLVQLAGLHAVQFGPGAPQSAHTADESVRMRDVLQCAHVLALTAGHFCGVAEEPVDNWAG